MWNKRRAERAVYTGEGKVKLHRASAWQAKERGTSSRFFFSNGRLGCIFGADLARTVPMVSRPSGLLVSVRAVTAEAQRLAEGCIRSRQLCQLFRLNSGYGTGHDHVPKVNKCRPPPGRRKMLA